MGDYSTLVNIERALTLWLLILLLTFFASCDCRAGLQKYVVSYLQAGVQ